MMVISREYHFSSAHQLDGHPKCGRMHGHNYKVVVEIELIGELKRGGMVLDFQELDKFVKPIVEILDHRYIVSQDNTDFQPSRFDFLHAAELAYIDIQYSTAECLAKWFYDQIEGSFKWEKKQKPTYRVKAVTIWETEKSSASYSRSSGTEVSGTETPGYSVEPVLHS